MYFCFTNFLWEVYIYKYFYGLTGEGTVPFRQKKSLHDLSLYIMIEMFFYCLSLLRLYNRQPVAYDLLYRFAEQRYLCLPIFREKSDGKATITLNSLGNKINYILVYMYNSLIPMEAHHLLLLHVCLFAQILCN